ncbi:MAG: hypothetical protein KatS3mg043_0600 [Rhodothermaceae bacterium]|nr:MAG: hypothetical protein KatS3mg043_0600 [Rhodothermaceae bacterium]
MQRTLLPLIGLILLLPAHVFGQWRFEGVFPPDPDLQFSSTHGVAVDPDGKIWIQPFGATDSVQVPFFQADDPEGRDGYRDVQVIYVFNPDGTPADFSPVKFLDFPGGERDTLGGFLGVDANGNKAWQNRTGRGLTTDADGNVIASQFTMLYKIDYTNGAGLAKVNTNTVLDPRGITEAAVDENNNVYVSGVFPGDPIAIYDSDLNYLGNAIDVTHGFSRGFEVSPDGNRIFWAGYTNNAVIEYARPDEFSPYDSIGVVIPGVDAESMRRDPLTGYLWVAAGSPNDPPNDYEGFNTRWLPQTWYSFDINDLTPNTVPTPQGSITWSNDETIYAGFVDGRPRGLAFSPDGNMAYVAQFSQIAPSVQVFSRADGVSLGEPTRLEQLDDVPSAFSLSPNFPNPFRDRTRITFSLEQPAHVRLKIYDLLGREKAVLVDRLLGSGTYEEVLDATNWHSGTYLYVLEANEQRRYGTMILIR